MRKKESPKVLVILELGELIALVNDNIARIKRGRTIDLYDLYDCQKAQTGIIRTLVAVGKLAREEINSEKKGIEGHNNCEREDDPRPGRTLNECTGE